MDYFDVIRERFSVRGYKKDPVEKEKLDIILEAARLAPTAVNFQPFKVSVISTEGREDVLRAIYAKDWFVQPPYVICVSVDKEKAWVRRDGRKFGDVDAAIVMDHIILAAAAQGLGTCWVGNFNVDLTRELLKLNDNFEPLLFTPLGYPACKNPRVKRKPLEELVEYIK